MTTREVRIDRSRPLTDQTETGHNRWHPDIPPIVECDPGDEVILETRDALDGQLTPETAPERYVATTGMPITDDGENRPGDLSLAARNALLAMIDELQERGFSRPQAYALCSVAVDLKVSQVVDVPNVLISAFLPLDIFE